MMSCTTSQHYCIPAMYMQPLSSQILALREIQDSLLLLFAMIGKSGFGKSMSVVTVPLLIKNALLNLTLWRSQTSKLVDQSAFMNKNSLKMKHWN